MERWDLRAENAVTNQIKGAGAISAMKRRRGEKLLGAGEHAFAGTQMKLILDGSRGRRERALQYCLESRFQLVYDSFSHPLWAECCQEHGAHVCWPFLVDGLAPPNLLPRSELVGRMHGWEGSPVTDGKAEHQEEQRLERVHFMGS